MKMHFAMVLRVQQEMLLGFGVEMEDPGLLVVDPDHGVG